MSTPIREHPTRSVHRTSTVLVAVVSSVLVAMGAGAASAGPPAPAVEGGDGVTVWPDRSLQSPITGMWETPGIDFSFTKPDPGVMADAGYTFAIGYVSHNPDKNFTAEVMAAYRAEGILVGLVWETTAARALEGHAAGAADGRAAEDQADAVGYPVDAVLFFAVDVDTTAADYPAIQAYAEAFNAVTRRPVGVYGEADVIDHFVTPGVQPVQYGWQTAAWSAGRLSEKANLYQRIGHPGWPVPAGIEADAFDEDVAILPVPLAG